MVGIPLEHAVELGEGHLPQAALRPARDVLQRAGERNRLHPERTVVALLGATGSGKSSLMNAVVGRDVARVAAIRPTTAEPLAVVFGGGADALLDWLGVRQRAEFEGPEGLIVVDLPDIDSVEAGHRVQAMRLADAVDVLIWVLDPEKYADAAIHYDFIRPFATHDAVVRVVLNQVDRISGEDRAIILDDLTGLLRGYGLTSRPLPVSARSGEGIAELVAELEELAAARHAAQARHKADVIRAARQLWEVAGSPAQVGPIASEAVISAAGRASGVPVVAEAVYRSSVRRGRARVGWPPVRWLARVRPDPLARLHLGRTQRADLARTSLPGPTPVQESALRAEAQRMASAATAPVPEEWRGGILTEMDRRLDGAIDRLDSAVAAVDYEHESEPRWWRAAGTLQWLLIGTAAVGALWLAALMALDYLRLPGPGTPHWGAVPWPTVLLLGGLSLGFAFAFAAMVLVRAGARRRARRVGSRLTEAIRDSIETGLVMPLRHELDEWTRFRDAVREAAGGTPE